MAEYVDSGKVIRAGSAATFLNTLTKDGATYNLTGKTVVATIRATQRPNAVIDATLEDMAVTLSTAASGIVTFSLTAVMSALLSPGSGVLADAITYYDVAYKVTTDDYLVSQLLRFGVTRGLD